jgi:16S rRNA (guanine1207-N2)-methyltransferase
MSDISAEALRLSALNAEINGLEPPPLVLESAGFKSIDRAGFDIILSNPPYHTDFSVPKEIIEKGFNRLKIGGRLFMVTKRLAWYKNKIAAVFGGVTVVETGGSYVFNAERRRMSRADKK